MKTETEPCKKLITYRCQVGQPPLAVPQTLSQYFAGCELFIWTALRSGTRERFLSPRPPWTGQIHGAERTTRIIVTSCTRQTAKQDMDKRKKRNIEKRQKHRTCGSGSGSAKGEHIVGATTTKGDLTDTSFILICTITHIQPKLTWFFAQNEKIITTAEEAKKADRKPKVNLNFKSHKRPEAHELLRHFCPSISQPALRDSVTKNDLQVTSARFSIFRLQFIKMQISLARERQRKNMI